MQIKVSHTIHNYKDIYNMNSAAKKEMLYADI
jgi:hypothetical protein